MNLRKLYMLGKRLVPIAVAVAPIVVDAYKAVKGPKKPKP
jgi:hypothetical protein